MKHGYLLASQIIMVGVSGITTLAASRTLGLGARGVLALALQLAYIGVILVILGSERALSIVWPGGRPTRKYWGVATVIWIPFALCTGVVVVLSGLVLLRVSNGSLLDEIDGTMVLVLGLALYRVIRAVYVSSGQLRQVLTLTLVTQCPLCGLVIGLFFVPSISHSVTIWIWLYAVAMFVPMAIIVVRDLRRRDFGYAEARDKRSSLRRTSWQLLIPTLANVMALRSDRLLLPLLSSTKELGLYITFATIGEVGVVPLQTILEGELPSWSSDPGSTRTRLVELALVGASIVAGGAVYVGSQMTLLILPAAYRQAAVIIPYLAAACTVYGLGRVIMTLILARRAVKAVARIETAGVVAAVILYFALIPRWEATGAAVASLIAYAMTAAAAAVVLRMLIAAERESN